MPWAIERLYESIESENFVRDINLFKSLISVLDDILIQMSSDSLNSIQVNEYLNVFEEAKKVSEGLQYYCYLYYFYNTSDQSILPWISKVDQMELTLSTKEIEFIEVLRKTKENELILESLNDAYKAYFIRQYERARKLLSVKEEQLLEKFQKLSLSKWQKLYQDTRKMVDFSVEGGYGLAEEVFAACLVNLKEGRRLLSQKMGYNSMLEQSVEGSRMSMKTFEGFRSSVQKHIGELNRFFSIRQLNSLLGLSEGQVLLPNLSLKKELHEEDKVAMMKKALGRLGKNIEEYIENCFSNGWIDSDIRDNKEQGNFCVPLRTINEIRIMVASLKYEENLIGLGHEMGHGYHFIQMMKGPFLGFDFPLAVSETPSIFFAITMLDYFLDNSDSKDKINYLDQLIYTLVFEILQMYSRFEFELQVVDNLDYSNITADFLNKLMSDTLRKNFGAAIPPKLIDDRLWMKKIQFFTSDKDYYNYPYVIGAIISIMLLDDFKQSPDKFLTKYNKFLVMTADSTFENMLSIFGYDASSSEFWDAAIGSIIKRINLYEELVFRTM